MLFYLTDSLIIEKTSPLFIEIRRAVRYIAMSVLESKHLLRGDYRVLEFFMQEFKNDIDIYPVFNILVTKYSTYTVPNELSRYIEVVVGEFADYEKGGHKIKQIPYGYFDDSSKVQAMTVVAEDEDDCALFEYIVKYYLKTNHLNFNHCFSSRGGGGSRTEVTVRSCLRDGRMVTCITDSDQRYPGDAIGSCARECRGINPLGRIYYYFMLPVHEVENMVPLNHFNKLDWSQEANKRDKEAFDKLCFNAKSELILPYFDLKEGIKKADIDQHGEGLKRIAAMCCFCNPDIMCGKSFHAYIEDLDSDSYVYPRLRKRIMGDLATLYRRGAMPDPELMDFQFDAWQEIAKLLIDATCARKKEAIIV